MLKANSSFMIDNTEISTSSPCYFIADIAANHDGDIQRAKDLIYTAKEAGADAAKFQHFTAKTIVSDYGFKSLGNQKSHQSKWKKSVFNVYEDASVSMDWTNDLKETCMDAGITFFTSPYSLELIDHIDPFVPAYKVGSGDITWIEVIEYMASKGKPILIASGASSIEDVDRAINATLKINQDLAIMQCNTNYTGSLENMKFINLKVIEAYKLKYPGMIIGLSDHTPGHATVLGAVALGATIVEKHFTDDTSREGPDHAFSMDPKSWNEMVLRTRELEAALGSEIKKIEDNEHDTAIIQRRCVRLKVSKSTGETLQASDLEVLRPCPVGAVPPYALSDCVGKKISRDIEKGDALMEDDFIN